MRSIRNTQLSCKDLTAMRNNFHIQHYIHHSISFLIFGFLLNFYLFALLLFLFVFYYSFSLEAHSIQVTIGSCVRGCVRKCVLISNYMRICSLFHFFYFWCVHQTWCTPLVREMYTFHGTTTVRKMFLTKYSGQRSWGNPVSPEWVVLLLVCVVRSLMVAS